MKNYNPFETVENRLFSKLEYVPIGEHRLSVIRTVLCWTLAAFSVS
jgi:hypothetical protein